MEIYYIPKIAFGEFFYDPTSRNGIVISDLPPVILGMESDYNPSENPNALKLNLEEKVFEELLKAAEMRSDSKVNKIILDENIRELIIKSKK
ncbi:MAG: hypothetical protein AABW50_02735 [Nanoarchaeota archaeon]